MAAQNSVADIGVKLTLDTSGFDAGVERAASSLTALRGGSAGKAGDSRTSARTGTTQAGGGDGGSVDIQAKFTTAQVNRALKAATEGLSSIHVPIDVTKQSVSAIRAKIIAELGTIPVNIAPKFATTGAGSINKVMGSVLSMQYGISQGQGTEMFKQTVSKLPPGKAAGGRVPAGLPVVVGERRPEVFVPETNGRIVPQVNQWNIPTNPAGSLPPRYPIARMGGGPVHALRGQRVAPLPPGQSMPPALGSSTVRPGYVRGYHMTKGSERGSAQQNLDSIRQQGLRLDRALGNKYGEPNASWFAGDTTLDEYQREYAVEAHLPQKWFDGSRMDVVGGLSPGRGSNAAVQGNISRRRFATYNEPWMSHYRYMSKEQALSGKTPGGIMRQIGPTIASMRDDSNYADMVKGYDQYVADSWRDRKRMGGGPVHAKLGVHARKEAALLGRFRKDIGSFIGSGVNQSRDSRDWYAIAQAQARGDMADFGYQGNENIGLLSAAALSPGQPWPKNRALFRQLLAGVPPEKMGGKGIDVPGFGDTSVGIGYSRDPLRMAHEIINARSEQEALSILSGPKVNPFGLNLTGLDPTALTLDRRMGLIATGGRTADVGKGIGRRAMDRAYREAYETHGVALGARNISEFQAILWSSMGRGEDLGDDWSRTPTGVAVPRHPGIAVPVMRMAGGPVGMMAGGPVHAMSGSRPRFAGPVGEAFSELAFGQFGETDDPGKAGWMSPQGKYLDFSAGKNHRYLEHRRAASLFPGMTDGGSPFGQGEWDAYEAMMERNWMRIAAFNDQWFGGEFSLPATNSQIARVGSDAKFMGTREAVVDWRDFGGNSQIMRTGENRRIPGLLRQMNAYIASLDGKPRPTGRLDTWTHGVWDGDAMRAAGLMAGGPVHAGVGAEVLRQTLAAEPMGGTFSIKSGVKTPLTGHAVAIPNLAGMEQSELTMGLTRETLTVPQVRAFIKRFNEAKAAGTPFVGTWLDEGTNAMDVDPSVVIKRKREAALVASAGGEKAGFSLTDLNRGNYDTMEWPNKNYGPGRKMRATPERILDIISDSVGMARGGKARLGMDFGLTPLASTMQARGSGFDPTFNVDRSGPEGWATAMSGLIRSKGLVSSYEADKVFGYSPEEVGDSINWSRFPGKDRKMASGGPVLGMMAGGPVHGVKFRLGDMRAGLRRRSRGIFEDLLEAFPLIGTKVNNPNPQYGIPGFPSLGEVGVDWNSSDALAYYSRPGTFSPPGAQGYGRRFEPGNIQMSGQLSGKKSGASSPSSFWQTASIADEVYDRSGRLIIPRGEDANFHPPHGRSIEGVSAHEFGHAAERFINGTFPPSTPVGMAYQRLRDDLMGSMRHVPINDVGDRRYGYDREISREGASKSISGYAKNDAGEAFAELFAERFIGGAGSGWGMKPGLMSHMETIQKQMGSLRSIDDLDGYINKSRARVGILTHGGSLDMDDLRGQIGRAAGGSGRGHGLYIVGEIGEELFVPERMAGAIPDKVMEQIPKAQGGAQVIGKKRNELFSPTENGWIIPNRLLSQMGHLMPHRDEGGWTPRIPGSYTEQYIGGESAGRVRAFAGGSMGFKGGQIMGMPSQFDPGLVYPGMYPGQPNAASSKNVANELGLRGRGVGEPFAPFIGPPSPVGEPIEVILEPRQAKMISDAGANIPSWAAPPPTASTALPRMSFPDWESDGPSASTYNREAPWPTWTGPYNANARQPFVTQPMAGIGATTGAGAGGRMSGNVGDAVLDGFATPQAGPYHIDPARSAQRPTGRGLFPVAPRTGLSEGSYGSGRMVVAPQMPEASGMQNWGWGNRNIPEIGGPGYPGGSRSGGGGSFSGGRPAAHDPQRLEDAQEYDDLMHDLRRGGTQWQEYVSSRTPRGGVSYALSQTFGGQGRLKKLQRQQGYQMREMERLAIPASLTNPAQVQTKKQALTHLMQYEEDLAGAKSEPASTRATSIETVEKRKREAVREVGPEAVAQWGEVQKTTKKLDIGLGGMARSMVSVIAGIGVYGVAMQGLSKVMEAMGPPIADIVDEMRGFSAVTEATTSKLGTQAGKAQGNVEATLNQYVLKNRLGSGMAESVRNDFEIPVATKSGAEKWAAYEEAGKALIGLAGKNGAAPAGTLGGYNGFMELGIAGNTGGMEAISGFFGHLTENRQQMPMWTDRDSDGRSMYSAGGDQTTDEADKRFDADYKAWESGVNPIGEGLEDLYAAGVKDLNTAASEYGRRFNGPIVAWEQITADTQHLVSQIRDSDSSDYFKTMAENGLFATVDGKAVVGAGRDESQAALATVVGGGYQSPEQWSVEAARSLSKQFEADSMIGERQQGIQIPFAMTQQLLKSPFLPPSTGVSMAGASASARATANSAFGRAAGVQDILGFDGGIAAAGLTAQRTSITEAFPNEPSELVNFDEAIEQAQKYSETIATQTKAMLDAQKVAQDVTVVNQFRLANRGLKDAIGLIGEVGGSRLGYLQREDWLAGRASQSLGLASQKIGLASQALGLALQRRSIATNLAVAQFQAPGETGEERYARQREAIIRANIEKKQLGYSEQQHGISEQQYGIATEQFVRAGQIWSINAKRGAVDAGKTLEVLQKSKDAQVIAIGAQKEMAVAATSMGHWLAKAGNIATRAETKHAQIISSLMNGARELDTTFTEVNNHLRKELLGETPAEKKERLSKDPTADMTPAETTAFWRKREHTGLTEAEKKAGNKEDNSAYAAGFVGNVSGASRMTVGEAGTETVAILRNPRRSSMGGGGGGGPVNLSININNPTVRNQGDTERLASQVAHEVERILSRKGEMLGLRSPSY